jgi:predicted alpha/beta-fold hydrolase
VDRSHPVDIKITWALVNRLALIEIKWLGKSLVDRRKQFTQNYTEARALSGANQLANYLDENLRQAPIYASKGYLVIFDARRAMCKTDTTILYKDDAMKYLNSDIQYNPEYHRTRTDFASPFRFFMEPKYLN